MEEYNAIVDKYGFYGLAATRTTLGKILMAREYAKEKAKEKELFGWEKIMS